MLREEMWGDTHAKIFGVYAHALEVLCVCEFVQSLPLIFFLFIFFFFFFQVKVKAVAEF